VVFNRLELPHADQGVIDRSGFRSAPCTSRSSGVEINGNDKETVADPRLQLAIYSATQRLIDHRASAVGIKVLPEYQDLRTLAHEIKKHTIEHLDYYLEQLEANVVGAWRQGDLLRGCAASDRLVLDLAKQRNRG